MGSFCGTNNQTVVNQASNPNVTGQQNQVYNMVNQYANQFGGNPSSLIAPQNQLQTSAEQGVANYATSNQPWNFLGEGMIGQGANTTGAAPGLYGQGASTLGGVNPIASTAWNPTAYESPYTQDVIDATMRNIQQQNAIQQNGALGNAISSGNAFGGDRAGVAQAELARNQELAANQTMAGLRQANFNQASQQANAQQQYLLNLGLGNNAQLMQQAGLYGQLGGGLTQAGLGMGNLGYQTGNLGNLGQAGTLNALQGLYNMGTGLQGTQQQQLSAPLTLGQWYANASPGTQAVPTSTVYPGSSPASTIAGLGLSGIAGASLLNSSGLLGGLFGGGAGAGAGDLAGGAIAGLGALVNRGGRINKDGGGAVSDEDDLVNRFHRIRHALHRAAGGPGGAPMPQQGQVAPADPLALASNVPHAQDMPTTQAYQRQRMYHLMRGVGDTADPANQQFAQQMLATQQAHHGGAIQKDVGGSAEDSADSAPTLAGSIGELSAQDKLGVFNQLAQMMKKVHRSADTLLTPNTSGSDPTKAPTAPGAGNSMANLGSNPAQAMQLANSVNKLNAANNATLDDSMLVARGGRTIGDLGRQHFDEGGGAFPYGTSQGFTDLDAKNQGWLDKLLGRVLTPDTTQRGQDYYEGMPNVLAGNASLSQPAADVTSGSALPTAVREPEPPAQPQPGIIPERDPLNTTGARTTFATPSAPADTLTHPNTRVSSSGPATSGATPGASPAPRGDYASQLAQMQMKYLTQMMDPRWTALNMGLRMMAHSGERDAHGLPISGAAAIGRGASEGLAERQAILGDISKAQSLALEAAKNPAQIEEMAARAKYYGTQADKEFLLNIEKQKMEYAKQLEMQQLANQLKFMQQWQEGASGNAGGKGTAVGPGVYTWGDGKLTPD